MSFCAYIKSVFMRAKLYAELQLYELSENLFLKNIYLKIYCFHINHKPLALS